MDHRSVGPSRPAEPLWQRAWLDAYPVMCLRRYLSRVPISTLMEMSAKRFRIGLRVRFWALDLVCQA